MTPERQLADDPLGEAPPMDDMEARRARAAIEGRLFSGRSEPVRVGRYRIEGRIGAGGMGVVYRAHDPELARDVAVKLLHPDTAASKDDRTARARLLREARAMARLAHPNVIHVYDVGAVEDGVFIAMELVDGQSLAQWQGEAPRDWREILAVCLDAGRGLAAAHDAGVVHRDFKPENVLIGADGRARVGDFGLAGDTGPMTGPQAVAPDLARTGGGRTEPSEASFDSLTAIDGDAELASEEIAGTLTRTGMLLGTPKYMAPEQEVGGLASPLADQFSFCVALHEALYGQPPFAGNTVDEYRKNVHAHRLRPPPSDSKVRAWVYAQIVAGLAVDPEARHPSMHALIERLEAAVVDPSAGRRRQRQRRRILYAAAGLVGLAGAAAAGLMLAPSEGTVIVERTEPAPTPPSRATPDPTTMPLGTEDRPTPALERVPADPSSPDPEPAGEPAKGTTAAGASASPAGEADDPQARQDSHARPEGHHANRRYCYFDETSRPITSSHHRHEFLDDGGVCWKCRKPAKTSGLDPAALSLEPSDCKMFLTCFDTEDRSQCSG